MANRERKRAARRKRKQRGAQRRAATAERREQMASRVEERNRAAREKLRPLGQDERPTVVTVAAVISALISLASLLGYVLWDTLRDDARPGAFEVLSFTLVVAAMAWGLWRARYWAVLGFQAVLGLVMVVTALGAIGSVTVGLALGNVVLLAVAGALFYFMVKAMARIQMPERRPRE